jgi:Zn-dependent M28 family amino/carboxypeptidase
MISSPGASDAAACVAVILEVARATIHTPYPPSNPPPPLILLLNGGEEMGLQASHGFISRRNASDELGLWAASVKFFVNMDAGGVGGKSLLVQASNSYLAKVFRRAAPHPLGSSIGQVHHMGGV